jgi:hypothetical protein
LLDGCADVGLRREMEDDFRVQLRYEVEQAVFPDVELVQLRAAAEILTAAAREIVDQVDAVAARKQRVHEVGADEACAAGDDRPHRGLS